MTRRLIVMRHAKSSWKSGAATDHERPLNKRGRRDAPRVAQRLEELGELENTLILFFSDNGANGAPPTAYPGQTEEHLKSFDNSLENRG